MTSQVAELTVVRHGQSIANVRFPEAGAAGLLDSGITGPDADVELSPSGRAPSAIDASRRLRVMARFRGRAVRKWDPA